MTTKSILMVTINQCGEMIFIGYDYCLDGGLIVHIQDTDTINQVALVGVVDSNNLVVNPKWVSWDRLTKH